ncbi:MAG: type II CRISPR-associated endonuclease Cas1 [Kiritimatiellia bacterium]
MIARTLCFSTPGKLTLRLEQLCFDGQDGRHGSFPMEDLGFVIIDNPQIVITAPCLAKLSEANVAVVIANSNHMPVSSLLPYAGHTISQEIFSVQNEASEAVNGRLWRQVIRQKIVNQAALMRGLNAAGYEKLLELAGRVKNRDETCCEAQAARIYFQALLPPGVNRDPDGSWPNVALNYGYAILRAAIARALTGSGLLCLKGIHHHNRYNAFCLADDIMEPYRPFVDQYVFSKARPFDMAWHELSQPVKARLLEVLTCDVSLDGLRRPLLVAATYTSASLAKYYLGKTEKLVLPAFYD